MALNPDDDEKKKPHVPPPIKTHLVPSHLKKKSPTKVVKKPDKSLYLSLITPTPSPTSSHGSGHVSPALGTGHGGGGGTTTLVSASSGGTTTTTTIPAAPASPALVSTPHVHTPPIKAPLATGDFKSKAFLHSLLNARKITEKKYGTPKVLEDTGSGGASGAVITPIPTPPPVAATVTSTVLPSGSGATVTGSSTTTSSTVAPLPAPIGPGGPAPPPPPPPPPPSRHPGGGGGPGRGGHGGGGGGGGGGRGPPYTGGIAGLGGPGGMGGPPRGTTPEEFVRLPSLLRRRELEAPTLTRFDLSFENEPISRDDEKRWIENTLKPLIHKSPETKRLVKTIEELDKKKRDIKQALMISSIDPGLKKNKILNEMKANPGMIKLSPEDMDLIFTLPKNQIMQEVVAPQAIEDFIDDDRSYANIMTALERHARAKGFAFPQGLFRPIKRSDDASTLGMSIVGKKKAIKGALPASTAALLAKKGVDFRAEQLANIMSIYNLNDDLRGLQALFRSHRSIAPDLYSMSDAQIATLIDKQRASEGTPDDIAKAVIENKKLAHFLDPNVDDALKELIKSVTRDRAAFQGGYMTQEEYQTKIEGYWEGLKNLSTTLYPMNPKEKAKLDAILAEAEKSITRRTLTDWNVFNDRLEKLDRVIYGDPNSTLSKKILKQKDQVMKDLQTGKIDLSEAYSMTNGMYNMIKNIIIEYHYKEGIDVTDPRFIHYPEGIHGIGQYTEEPRHKIPPEKPNPLPKIETMPTKQVEDLYNTIRGLNIMAFPAINFPSTGSGKNFGKPVALGTKYLNAKDRRELEIEADRFFNSEIEVEKEEIDKTTTPPTITKTPVRIKWTKAFTEDEKNLLDEIGDSGIRQLARELPVHLTSKFAGKLKVNSKFLPALGKISASLGSTIDTKERLKQLQEFGNQLTAANSFAHALDKKAIPDLENTKISELKKRVINFDFLRGPPAKPVPVSVARPKFRYKSEIRKLKGPGPKSLAIDREFTDAERRRRKLARETKFSQENFKYSKRISKEEPEVNKAHIGKNIIEFDVKNEADLMRMKSEVSKLKGRLYIVDLKTGRLFPITLDKTFIQANYIFQIEPTTAKKTKNPALGGGFSAYYPTLHRIQEDSRYLLPHVFMRDGNDKAQQMFHLMAQKPYFNDLRDQQRQAQGAGFWKVIRKGIQEAAQPIAQHVIRKTSQVGQQLVKDTINEGKRFYNNEKRNVNYISNANKEFYKNPSLGGLNKVINKTMLGGVRLVTQPVIAGSREAATFSDAVGQIPGLNVAKAGIKMFVPPVAVADALVHGIKNADEGKYYDAAINAGDALLASGKLKGAVDLGARVATTGLKIGDMLGADSNQHK